MKRISLIVTALSFIVGCSNDVKTVSISNSDKSSPVLPSNSEQLNTTKDWKKYWNARYGFEIKYPAEWEDGEESDNGDGMLLYIGDPDIRIAASAINNVEGTTLDDSLSRLTYQKIKLDDGGNGDLYIGKEERKNFLYLKQYKGNVEYTFDVEVPSEFYDKNYKILMSVAKSFHVLEESLMD
jgi:hypothetical protein